MDFIQFNLGLAKVNSNLVILLTSMSADKLVLCLPYSQPSIN